MQKRRTDTLIASLAATLLLTALPARADSLAGNAQANVSISLTIAHPVRMQVQADVICLYNYAERTFSVRQTQGTRAFDHNDSIPSRYRTLENDQCKSGQALQLDAAPGRGEEYALLHVLIEPD